MSQQNIMTLLEQAEAGSSSSIVDLAMLLEAVRCFLNMDVAFTSRFTDSQRRVELVQASSAVATPIPAGSAEQLDNSYCFKIACGQLDNIVPDTMAHPVTRDMRVTRQLSIGAYIGVPITLQNGDTYGALCCYDNKPNAALSRRDVDLLHSIASYVGQVMGRTLAQQQKQDLTREQVRYVIDQHKIEVVFQPIYGKHSARYEYYEVLARFNTDPYRPPNEWLHDADTVGLGLEVESAIIHRVVARLNSAKARGLEVKTSINVSPQMVESGLLPELLKAVDSRQVKIELTEHVRVKDYQRFRTFLRPLSDRGFKICIDDVGAGFASLKHILEIEPDVIKLDLSLASNIHLDKKRQALVTGLLAFAHSFNCEVVAEGIETQEEYQALEALGVAYFQGWYFSRPVPFEQLAESLEQAC